MNSLEKYFIELKLAIARPALYLANYFEEMRCQIDMACETYSTSKDCESEEKKEKAIQLQIDMINQVDQFDKECLFNLTERMGERKGDLTELENVELFLKTLDFDDKEAVLNTE